MYVLLRGYPVEKIPLEDITDRLIEQFRSDKPDLNEIEDACDMFIHNKAARDKVEIMLNEEDISRLLASPDHKRRMAGVRGVFLAWPTFFSREREKLKPLLEKMAKEDPFTTEGTFPVRELAADIIPKLK